MEIAPPIVRPAEPRDRAEWLRLRRALWPHHDPVELEREIEMHIKWPSTRAAFVAERENGRLCGLIEVSIRDRAKGCRTSGVGAIEGWYVDQDSREHGVGRVLVAAVEDWARANGCRELASDTTPRYPASRGAHAALGFEEVAVTYHFRKELRAP